MTSSQASVELISIDEIHVLNARSRNQAIFSEVVQSISKVGLKRPITVTRREAPQNGARFNLVCGQGRIEAFRALGQSKIPARIVTATKTDCLLMSLVENVARRRHTPLELVFDIRRLELQGLSASEIGQRTGLSADYVRGILKLIKNGEERLIKSVDAGEMPLSVAIEIADSNNASIQNVLADAYDNGLLRGRRLLKAKRLVEKRFEHEKGRSRSDRRPKPNNTLSTKELVRTYEKAADAQRLMLRRAEHASNTLAFISGALSVLFRDEHFLTLLRAERLTSVPECLSERLDLEAMDEH